MVGKRAVKSGFILIEFIVARLPTLQRDIITTPVFQVTVGDEAILAEML
jgi:hypothetical protein